MDRQGLRYILELVEDALSKPSFRTGCPDRGLMMEARSRMNELDVAKDLSVPVRSQFLKLRKQLNTALSYPDPNADMCVQILTGLKSQVLDPMMADPAPQIASRFTFISDSDLREILAGDMAEAEASLAAGLPKACVVLCGSILEAAIYDRLRANASWVMARASAIPGKRGGGKREITSDTEEDQWKLGELLSFCSAHGIIDASRVAGLGACVREPRNFVHPIVSIRKGERPTMAMARVAIGLVEMALSDLKCSRNPPRL